MIFKIDCYDDCDFTFEDEVNASHKIYGEKIKNYCDAFGILLYNKIIELKSLKNEIAENLIFIKEKQPDDWKKHISKDVEYQRILIEERNKWNKIIKKHKDNMINNGIKCDKRSCEVVKDYHKLMTGSRRW